MVCTASGWFPKPQVQWSAANGEKFLTFSETHTEDAEGLFSVEAALVVRDSSSGNITCSVFNPVLDQKKAMAIFIPGQHYFPLSAEPERVAWASCGCWAGLSWTVSLMWSLAGHRAFFPPGLSLEVSFHTEPDGADARTHWGCLLHQERTYCKETGATGMGETAQGKGGGPADKGGGIEGQR